MTTSSAGRARTAPLLMPVYAATLFLSAFLLFAVQPMFTKMVLPRLGGSPAVWNTAMVFFQATLLAGYLYAHLSARLLPLRIQQAVHGLLLLAAVVFLPVALGPAAVPPEQGQPVAWLLGVLAASVGLPFLAVSATAPLLQRWFAHVDHPEAADPYFLYGASNLGSLLALLAYPVAIEMTLGLRAQSLAWMAGYLLLMAAIAACAWLALHHNRTTDAPTAQDATALVQRVTWPLRLRWLLLALVPSSMLLGATLHVGTDIAAAPFLWVLPLALYLLSFVLVFARRPLFNHRAMLAAQALWLVLVAVLFETPHLYVLLVLHVGGVFFTAMVCHGELARLRPVASRLTEFYLWMSLGGVVGGVLSAIVAPLVFNSVYEYPLAMLAAVLLRPWRGISWIGNRLGWRRAAAATAWGLDVLLPIGLWLLLVENRWRDLCQAAGAWVFERDIAGVATRTADSYVPWVQVMAGGAFTLSTILLLLLLSRRPLRFALGMVAVLAVLSPDVLGTIRYEVDRDASFALPKLAWSAPDYRLERARSFFGVYSVNVTEVPGSRYHVLVNGTTNHGAQNRTLPLLPITYYAREGPVGQAFALMRMEEVPKRLAVIGLGVGALSCFVGDDQSMTFFEIDPLDARFAQDPRYFTYMQDCPRGPVNIVLGDGRLNIAKEPDGAFDVIMVDAFSGDAIPVHLLTKEAIELYKRKLSPKGMILFHITNTYIDLRSVVANVVADAGLHARHVDFNMQMMTPFALLSEWVVAARPEENDLLRFTWLLTPWTELKPDPRMPVWTDDRSNILRHLRWRQYGLVPVD